MRSQISIGDLVTALATLQPRDPPTIAAIQGALGVRLPPRAEPPPPVPDPDGPGGAANGAPALDVAREGAAAGDGLALHPAELAYVRTERPGERTPLSAGPLESGSSDPLPPPRPLLTPRTSRGIVGAALSTHDDHGPVDIAAIVERLGRGEPFDELPRQRWPTLRHGAQVLLDGGAGMSPYAADAEALLAELRRHFGHERLSVARFTGCPTRAAGLGPRRRWGRWRPPRPGMPIALISDLGIARPPLSGDAAPAGEWLRFAAEASHARCPLVAFVPYRASRVPAPLRRAMAIVEWSERTSASRVRGGVGGVLRRSAA